MLRNLTSNHEPSRKQNGTIRYPPVVFIESPSVPCSIWKAASILSSHCSDPNVLTYGPGPIWGTASQSSQEPTVDRR
jgi:hypothetical protein